MEHGLVMVALCKAVDWMPVLRIALVTLLSLGYFPVSKPLFKLWALTLVIWLIYFMPIFMWQTDLVGF